MLYNWNDDGAFQAHFPLSRRLLESVDKSIEIHAQIIAATPPSGRGRLIILVVAFVTVSGHCPVITHSAVVVVALRLPLEMLQFQFLGILAIILIHIIPQLARQFVQLERRNLRQRHHGMHQTISARIRVCRSSAHLIEQYVRCIR